MGTATGRTLTRAEAAWYYEPLGRCDLRNIPVGEKIALVGDFAENCAALFPKNLKELRFISEGREGASELRVRLEAPDFGSEACFR